MLRFSLLAAATAAFFAAVSRADGPNPTCYNNSGDLKNFGYFVYQSQSACSTQCGTAGDSVWATTQGGYCYCGNEFPSTGQVDTDTFCTSTCNGYPQTMCGGPKAWTFGITNNGTVISAGPDSSSTSSTEGSSSGGKSSATTTAALVATTIYATPIITATAAGDNSTPSASTSSPTLQVSTASHSTSSAGIAAGAVVGVIAVIAIAVGSYLFIRRRRRISAEEEYRAAVSAKEFTSSVKKPVSDHRLDPVMLQQRRLSDGSIADNQDYSRRILKVTNPDGN